MFVCLFGCWFQSGSICYWSQSELRDPRPNNEQHPPLLLAPLQSQISPACALLWYQRMIARMAFSEQQKPRCSNVSLNKSTQSSPKQITSLCRNNPRLASQIRQTGFEGMGETKKPVIEPWSIWRRTVCSVEQRLRRWGQKQDWKKMTWQKLPLFARDKPEKLIELDSRNDLSSLSAAAPVLNSSDGAFVSDEQPFAEASQWSYLLLVEKKIQLATSIFVKTLSCVYSIKFRLCKFNDWFQKKVLVSRRRHCFGQNGQKMQALNLQSVWKCNFYMVWAGRGPKEELVSRLCQNTGGQIYFGQNGTTATLGRILMLPAQSHADDEKVPPSFREDPFCTFQF